MSEVFHSAGVPGATRCSESATGTEEARTSVAGDSLSADPSRSLCILTLQSVACACLDAIGLVRKLPDDDDGTLLRALEASLQLVGIQVSRVLKVVDADDVICELDDWLLDPLELDMVRRLEARS